MAEITCPGCGAKIDTETNTAEFRSASQETPPVNTPGESQPVVATQRRGNAFLKPRKREE